MVNRVIDSLIVFRILKMLTTPFRKQQAYKFGFIDDRCNRIKKIKNEDGLDVPNNPETAKENQLHYNAETSNLSIYNDNSWHNISTDISSKADINSPAFTGQPTAPTAAEGTNSTQLATTAIGSAAQTLKEKNVSAAISGFRLAEFITKTIPENVQSDAGQAAVRTAFRHVDAFDENGNIFLDEIIERYGWYFIGSEIQQILAEISKL